MRWKKCVPHAGGDEPRLNLYAELQIDQLQQGPEKGICTLYPTPGTVQFVDFGANVCRGIWEKNDY
ncbi:MAG: hypothetical protein ABI167_10750, partial [Nitrosospira sp.]